MTKPVLVVRLGRRSWRFGAESTVLVGRGGDCDVQVDDPRVSRQHLRIGYHDGWVVHDTGSAHGTWVDRERLSRQPVLNRLTLRLADAADGQRVELELDPLPREHVGEPGVLTVGRAPAGQVPGRLAAHRSGQPQRCDREQRAGRRHRHGRRR